MTNISNTGYTIQNNQIHDPDGNAISQDQFLNQVESKKIALTGNALTVLGESFGKDYANQLAQTKGGNTETLTNLNDKLVKSDIGTGDITLNILQLIHKTRQTQKESARQVAETQVKLQKDKIIEQADKMKDAAITRMVTGLVAAGIQAGAGIAQIKGGTSAMKASKAGASDGVVQAMSTKAAGQGQLIGAGGQAVSALGQGIAGIMDADAKKIEADVTEAAHRTDEAKKMRDNADETEKKARETIQAVLQARDQAMSKAVNMS